MTVNNLRELYEMPPGVERVKAVNDYIRARTEAIREARELRDDDIRVLIDEHGLAKAARMVKISLTTAKMIRGRAPALKEPLA